MPAAVREVEACRGYLAALKEGLEQSRAAAAGGRGARQRYMLWQDDSAPMACLRR